MRWFPTTNFGFENADTVAIGASASSVAVTFDTAFPSGITPSVVFTPDQTGGGTTWNTSFSEASIGNTGFTARVGTTSAYAQTIDYHAFANA